MTTVVTKDEFEKLSSLILRKDLSRCSPRRRNRRFRGVFGMSSKVCAVLWEFLVQHSTISRKKGSSPKHLLWTLMVLKLYATEETNAAMAGVDEKTFRKWCWIVLNEMKKLKKYIVSTALYI